jgi:hypothetical protein
MTDVNVNAAGTTFVAVVSSSLRRHGNANDLHMMTGDERREVASALPPGRMCARVQKIHAGERLPNCARMIVEEIQAWEEWRAPNWVPFRPGLRTKKS